MHGYTKLFGSLIGSTIWREPDHVRLVWITMLALKNQYHRVEVSLPGLADFAKVSLEKCKEALEVLKGPDEYSRSKEHGGRRIKEIDGGWEILNGQKYRDRMNKEDRRESNRLAQQRVRAKVPRKVKPAPGAGLLRYGGDTSEIADAVNDEMERNRGTGWCGD